MEESISVKMLIVTNIEAIIHCYHQFQIWFKPLLIEGVQDVVT